MPIREWFIILSQFCSNAWSNQLVNRFANQFEWFVQFPVARAESSEAVKSAERSRATCSRRNTPLNIRLQKYRLHFFAFCRTDGRRSLNVHLFRYVQMFGNVTLAGHVRSFHSSPCQVMCIIYFEIAYNLIQWCKSEFSSVVTPVFRVIWSSRNHSYILVIISVGNSFAV